MLQLMKSFLVLLCVACCVSVALGVAAKPFKISSIRAHYHSYCLEYGKEATEKGAAIFAANVEKINAHNANPLKSYTKAINKFTDMSDDELKAFLGDYHDSPLQNVQTKFDLPTAPPASWDWRSQGAVNPIKDQGQCGVCWAFAATSAVESAYFINSKKLVSLSESQQANCDTSGGCNECAFQWLQSVQPCTEASFPYKCPDSRGCPACTVGAPKIKSFVRLPVSNETALKSAVYTQPVAIGIAAAGDFMSYSSGIFDGSCPGGRDHAVVLVGYGTENGKDYWILRNSWNTGWGEKGYMRIARGGHGADGICILATDPSVPIY